MKFRECGICGQYHPVDFEGDCRDDANRYSDPAVICDACNGNCYVGRFGVDEQRCSKCDGRGTIECEVVITEECIETHADCGGALETCSDGEVRCDAHADAWESSNR